MKKLLLAALFAPLVALGQTYPSPTFQNTTITGTLTAGALSASTLSGATIPSGALSIVGQYATLTSTPQTASMPSATLYAVPSSGAGLYLVIVDIQCTTAGTAGTVSASLGWNNGSASASVSTGSMSLTTLGNETTQMFAVNSAASQNITYSTTVSGATGSPQYSIRMRVVFLG
jgi:hypothetical protein